MESIASWVATIATTIAALMTASNLGSRITGSWIAGLAAGVTFMYMTAMLVKI